MDGCWFRVMVGERRGIGVIARPKVEHISVAFSVQNYYLGFRYLGDVKRCVAHFAGHPFSRGHAESREPQMNNIAGLLDDFRPHSELSLSMMTLPHRHSSRCTKPTDLRHKGAKASFKRPDADNLAILGYLPADLMATHKIATGIGK